MTAKLTLIDRGIAVLETELDLLVEEYHGAPMSLPPQRIAEVFGRYFALECLRAYGVNGFQYASAGFIAILDMLREILLLLAEPNGPPDISFDI